MICDDKPPSDRDSLYLDNRTVFKGAIVMRMSLAFAVLLAAAPAALGQDHHWVFDRQRAEAGFAANQATPKATPESRLSFGPAAAGRGLVFDGTQALEIAGDFVRPTKSMTVGALVAVDTPQQWGGIIGCVEDTGDYEKGWVLGYDRRTFTFGISTTGADDGNGNMTYVAASLPYREGRWHHVVATYDGATTTVYVDGARAATSDRQHGPLLYHDGSTTTIGAYRDSNENHMHDGRLHEVRLLSRVMTEADVHAWYEASSHLVDLDPWVDTDWAWLVEPYLTWPTLDGISIMCETTEPTTASVDVWHESGSPRVRFGPSEGHLHEFRADGLEPNEKYFYQISGANGEGVAFASDVLSFRTAATPDRPFTFVAIGDTQSQPEVVKRVSDMAYMTRPNFVVHCGDLVSTGSNKQHWTDHFFPNMQPLISRAPLVPVLGNHEQDARHYYDYMSLPEPEMWYSLTYANAEFFMIDGNRSLRPQSEQLDWLRTALSESKATWKFAVLHQPPYTSDSNDYGDTLRTTSSRGDPNVQNIIKLLEQHGVDICFSGHVHDYERTFPIRGGSVTSYKQGGVIYVTTAGGGGGLEDFDPANTWFGHRKARYHHLVYVAINGDELEFQAIDEHGRLFDVMTLQKSAAQGSE